MAATAVLVHGAWHGAWCFDPVVERLRAEGIDAIAVDLPGHGDDPGPLSDLHGDAARVRRVLDDLDGDCVLVGHSYGGAVITEAGAHPSVRHLVFLAAFALDTGESCIETAIKESEALDLDWGGRPNLADAFVGHPDGTSTITPEGAAERFYLDCSDEETTWAISRLGPQPMVTLADVPTAISWHDRPSTYVVCTDDLAVHPDLQRVMAARCTTSVEWPTSHSPFLSAPERVAGLVASLVRDTHTA